jgi:hypothetical protein
VSTDYNAATWSAADLLTEVYRACAMPDTGTVDWTPAAVLREATNVIWSFAGPAVAKAREGRLATSLLRAVTGASVTVSGQDYELPPMALGDSIDAVAWVNQSGSIVTPLDVIPLGLEDAYSSPEQRGDPQYFALLDGTVRVYPRPSSVGSLRVTYQRRHGELVQLGTDNATVNSVIDNGGSARVTLSTTPAAFVAGAWVDFVGVRYPHRTKLHGAVIVTAHGSSQFTLSTSYAAFIAAQLVGDTAVTYGKTPYVQLPLEMRGALNSKIAAKITGAIGDVSMHQLHQVSAQDEMARAKDALSPRTKSARQKAFNPRSIARSALPRGIPRWSRRDD